MKFTNSTLLLLSFFLISEILFSQSTEGITNSGQKTGQEKFPINSYTEFTNPTPTPLEKWKESPKTIVGWGKTDKRYQKEQPISKDSLSKKINLKAWRERKSFSTMGAFGW